MRKLRWLAAVGLFVAAGATTALACGDKFLVLGRGLLLHTAGRPASVLLYLGQKDGKPTLGSKELQSTLKNAGHKLETVDDTATLERDAKSGKFDVVLAEYGDALALADRVKGASANLLIVPVMGKANNADYTAAQKQFTYVVKSSGDPSEYLTRIDQAMKSRLKPRG
jgi:hypothetical protein